ncbi:MAG: SusC/RagA family TonB-linked outer membrane protein [Gemmatimonas sp.]|jgi:TonB-linked SusC/RagA family outer membrane protein|uniref:SusC/RagA family TonB-linked outer membrane protein n=1 Tax=Gemmatimonas sp. TaxID=1962908 RepID=UPI00391F3F85|nr:SusC/RagA family TonB-linked outer membrane protein [Gemmatimonadota bacterium]
MPVPRPTCRLLVSLALLMLGGPTALRAQGQATISGLVTDSLTKRPLVGAEVAVVSDAGTLSGSARVGENGRYSIVTTTVGPVIVRVRLVGYAQAARRLTLRAGDSYTADFLLTERTAQLDQIVVTGTAGVTQRRAIGNVVNTVDASKVLETAPARSVEQLLGARTPGLIVLPATGQVGTGAQLRVRGASSLSLSNDPLVFIDGIRMDASASRGPGQRGGAGASRLNDINPQDIESIEVIKGPAASTLYGTEASNGVIQIITKRGKSGKAKFDFTTRQGSNWLANPEGRTGLLWGRTPSGELFSVNLYEYEKQNGAGPIFTNGRNSGYNANLSGGTDASRYFLSASYDDDVGIVPWNYDKKFSGRVNADVVASKTLNLSGSIGYVRARTRLAQPAIDVDPFSQVVWGNPLTLTSTRRGFQASPPESWRTVESRADVDRTTLSLRANYNPTPWFTHRLTTGLDIGAENNWLLYPRQPLGANDVLGSNGLGTKNVNRNLRTVLTLDYAGSLKYNLGENVNMTSSFGLQHYRNELAGIGASAITFPAGPITTVSGGATRAGTEDYFANASVGMFVQQEAAWRNRVFLTAAVRSDDNSSFGKDFSAIYYPKFSASWVISEEPWFTLPFTESLRLRSALGASGTQPGTFDAARLYDPSVGYQNQPGLVPASFGNPTLRPERSTEFEGGFEATMFDGRTTIEFTRYSRNITDAIVNAPIPPSVGFPGSQVINVGRVSGWGNELAVNYNALRGERVQWEIGTQWSSNRNRIEDMGATQFLTVGGGGQAQNRVGFGIADIFMYKVRSATLDANGNVLSSLCDGGTGRAGLMQGGPDVPCAQAPRVFWGHTQPVWQFGVNSTLTLWKNLRLYARVDGNGGHVQSNTEIRARHNQGTTQAVILRNDPLLQVYRAIEADAPGTYKAGFLRLRELSATYTLAPSWARTLRASAASISVAGRNLSMLWTEQHGWNTSRDGQITVDVANMTSWDPEIRAVGQLSNGFQTILPPTASFVTTLRLTF